MNATDVLLRLADRLEAEPNRRSDLYAIRGKARGLGLKGDWPDLLPDPDGAHHGEYAARLRAIAGGDR